MPLSLWRAQSCKFSPLPISKTSSVILWAAIWRPSWRRLRFSSPWNYCRGIMACIYTNACEETGSKTRSPVLPVGFTDEITE
ncbi:hypothetical protein TRIATDRAFT_300866 [Trichoderma atroviride IMI 206040]|uniref:Uncharacterized protein n=1 Tax=Hypocrea atroviridis (strain ATCC 20476 / IMI 206040) TaxID=452589 RepID=G9P373_HYPAI|nr:uncharacterized protein TRIATDRAFT_300866 [Trichoderma atroviride IMI 206040]EHK42836.1 hypothetical protein TRIATDRAFT_300866 [Trichoderma atroviride IMI 206040]